MLLRKSNAQDEDDDDDTVENTAVAEEDAVPNEGIVVLHSGTPRRVLPLLCVSLSLFLAV